MSGLQTSGHHACPCCGEAFESKYCPHMRKCYYMGHTKYLPLDHEMRGDRVLCPHGRDDRPIPKEPDSIDWQAKWYAVEYEGMARKDCGMTRLS
ncbi:hypothetical protein GMA10_12975, partial [Kocuria koreensis]|nr:hypothetical protein [Rothia koreensis]